MDDDCGSAARRERPSALTEGGGHDFSLLPRRLHRSSDSEQLSDLQVAAALLGPAQFLQFSDWIEASSSPITVLSPRWRWQITSINQTIHKDARLQSSSYTDKGPNDNVLCDICLLWWWTNSDSTPNSIFGYMVHKSCSHLPAFSGKALINLLYTTWTSTIWQTDKVSV